MSRVAAQVATNPELYEEDLFRAILDDVEEHGPSAVSAISLLWLKRCATGNNVAEMKPLSQ